MFEILSKTLTNDVVSFEQPGPGLGCSYIISLIKYLVEDSKSLLAVTQSTVKLFVAEKF